MAKAVPAGRLWNAPAVPVDRGEDVRADSVGRVVGQVDLVAVREEGSVEDAVGLAVLAADQECAVPVGGPEDLVDPAVPAGQIGKGVLVHARSAINGATRAAFTWGTRDSA